MDRDLDILQNLLRLYQFLKAWKTMFELVDVILLVDNASQPMQYSSLTALRRAVVSGYRDRLIIAFTHFDLVKGENFESSKDRRMHVYCSLRHGLSHLKKDLGPYDRSV